MFELHHFSYSWQLIPEKGSYGDAKRPKSGNLRIRPLESGDKVIIDHQWVDIQNTAFITEYAFAKQNTEILLSESEGGMKIITQQKNQYDLQIEYCNEIGIQLKISLEILPNGYLKFIKQENDEKGCSFENTEFYHKQFSVLPYASSVGTAVIKPTEEGMIRHKALSAMEEQTNMQLDQIKKQIELLAQQAQEIYKRKELSMMIYEAKLSFQPVIGHIYHLYTKKDDSMTLSLISPNEWGMSHPFKNYHGAVKMLADHTWIEISE